MVASGRLKKLLLSFIFIISSVLLLSKTVLQRRSPNDPLPPDESIVQPTFQTISPPIFSKWTAKPCQPHQPLKLLILIHSSPSHILHRKAIRQTWGPNILGHTRTVFVVGRSKLPRIQQRVIAESQKHDDIVGVEMVDSYNNLTLKHLSGLNWSLKNCPGASYILKADDDAFVDIPRALKVVESADLSPNTIACRVVPQGTSPRRFGKWTVTKLAYPFQEYPEYCSGLAYFARPSTIAKVFTAAVSGQVPYLWIDDVFVTGLAAQVAGVVRLDLGVWFARTEDVVVKWMGGDHDPKRVMPWIIAEMTPRHWPSEAMDLWRKVKIAEQNAVSRSMK